MITISQADNNKFPPVNEASYLRYQCHYCLADFYLVVPETHMSGGAIQREVLVRDIHSREISKVGRVQAICNQCVHDITARSQIRRE